MRIDYDLLRDILQQVAECEDVHGLNAPDMKRHGYDDEIIAWHLDVLLQEDYLTMLRCKTLGCPTLANYYEMRFTMKGQEFFDSIRSNKIWNALKEKATVIGTELSVEFIKQAAPIVLRSLLNPSGIVP